MQTSAQPASLLYCKSRAHFIFNYVSVCYGKTKYMLDGFSFYHSVSFFLLLGGFLSLHPSLSSVSFCIAICWPLSLIFCVGPLLLPVSLTSCHFAAYRLLTFSVSVTYPFQPCSSLSPYLHPFSLSLSSVSSSLPVSFSHIPSFSPQHLPPGFL